MAPEKVADMVLNVDLKCPDCYKKVKKVICKIPQIRDQVFDVDKNTVKIKVVCCSPEKIRDKLCYKGGGAIQSIEIIEKSEKPKSGGSKPQEVNNPKSGVDMPKDIGKLKEPGMPKPINEPKTPQKPKPAHMRNGYERPKPVPMPKPMAPQTEDIRRPPEPNTGRPNDTQEPKDVPEKPDPGPNSKVARMVYEPVQGYPQMYPPSGYPMVGYGQYYDHGYGGAPFQHGYGMPIAPPPPPPSYGGFGYDNGYDRCNGNRSHYNSNDYEGQEEGEGCSIM